MDPLKNSREKPTQKMRAFSLWKSQRNWRELLISLIYSQQPNEIPLLADSSGTQRMSVYTQNNRQPFLIMLRLYSHTVYCQYYTLQYFWMIAMFPCFIYSYLVLVERLSLGNDSPLSQAVTSRGNGNAHKRPCIPAKTPIFSSHI